MLLAAREMPAGLKAVSRSTDSGTHEQVKPVSLCTKPVGFTCGRAS